MISVARILMKTHHKPDRYSNQKIRKIAESPITFAVARQKKAPPIAHEICAAALSGRLVVEVRKNQR